MIFVAAGTKDGRELAGIIQEAGFQVIASVVSQYGESLLRQYQGIRINCQPMDKARMKRYMADNKVNCFVDASHPYAANVSTNAMSVCQELDVPYIRYERKAATIDYDKVYYTEDYASAAKKAAELGRNVFLTTGSRSLEIFSKEPALNEHSIICRILPEPEVVLQARALGFTPDRIVAMQGPFSKELNKELFKRYNTDVVVTKNSGQMGGADTKLAAVKELGIPVVMIDRPQIKYTRVADSYEGVMEFIKKIRS